MSRQTAPVSYLDRLGFTVFLALALHAILIFGLSFSFDITSSRSPTLDVTLSLHDTDTAASSEEADFLADSNQQGSGTLSEAEALKTTEQAEIEDNQIFHTTPVLQQLMLAESGDSRRAPIVTQSSSVNQISAPTPADGSTATPFADIDLPLLEQINDVATLKALLDESRQAYAKRPRLRTLTSVSTRRAVDARYIHEWLQKVERIGNQNYPESARLQRITGAVRLAVSIHADGSLDSVQILESSGHAILDQAAKQIVFLSAPFPSFDIEMLEEYDVLEIIRTWQFRTDNSLGLTDG